MCSQKHLIDAQSYWIMIKSIGTEVVGTVIGVKDGSSLLYIQYLLLQHRHCLNAEVPFK